MSGNNDNPNEERYRDILAKNTSTMNLLSNIERSQKRRKFKAWVRRWWYKLTFRGYKNEQQKITKGRLS